MPLADRTSSILLADALIVFASCIIRDRDPLEAIFSDGENELSISQFNESCEFFLSEYVAGKVIADSGNTRIYQFDSGSLTTVSFQRSTKFLKVEGSLG